MADVIIPDKAAKPVIRIDDICYELVGPTTDPTTHDNADIQAQYDDCEDCANDELSSESSSSISISFSSQSSSSSNLDDCENICIESDWSIDDPSGTYVYNPGENLWELEGSMDFYIIFESGEWRLKFVSDVVYTAPDVGIGSCPPSSGNWSFVGGGTSTTFILTFGPCPESSSNSSSSSFSRSESSSSFSRSESSSSGDEIICVGCAEHSLSTEHNGPYQKNGTENGKFKYQGLASNSEIVWNPAPMWWGIYDNDLNCWIFGNDQDTVKPPEDGWFIWDAVGGCGGTSSHPPTIFYDCEDLSELPCPLSSSSSSQGFSSSSSANDTICVEGAIHDAGDVDGTYNISGTDGTGRAIYTREDSAAVIQWDNTNVVWAMQDTLLGCNLYGNASTGMEVPLTGWIPWVFAAGCGGVYTANPTISLGECPESSSQSSSSVGFSSSSSSSVVLTLSSSSYCQEFCVVDSDWSEFDLEGEWIFLGVSGIDGTPVWEKEGDPNYVLLYEATEDIWKIRDVGNDCTIFENTAEHDVCPPEIGWAWTGSCAGTGTNLSIDNTGPCAYSSSSSSSLGLSSSSSSRGLSSSSSSLGLSSSSSSQGISSSSSSQGISSSSSSLGISSSSSSQGFSSSSSSQGFSSSSSSLGISSQSSSEGHTSEGFSSEGFTSSGDEAVEYALCDNSSSSQSAVAACVGKACTTCTGSDPSVKMTITADDADLPITWGGVTWEKSTTTIIDADTQAHSGCSMCLCPKFPYTRNTNFSSASSYTYDEVWFVGVFSTGLTMVRRAKVNFTGLFYSFQNSVKGRGNIFHNRYLFPFASPTAYGTIETPVGFDPLSAVVKPNRFASADNRITDEYFTSVTISGVTYEWEKGDDWP